MLCSTRITMLMMILKDLKVIAMVIKKHLSGNDYILINHHNIHADGDWWLPPIETIWAIKNTPIPSHSTS